MKYFELFGITPVRLSLSAEELEKKFHELSFNSHPDRNPNDPEALTRSAEINQAYRKLKDPWARAQYFLGEEALTGGGAKVPPALAEIYFELQETEDPAALKTLYSQILQSSKDRLKSLEELFVRHDQGDGDKVRDELKRLLIENTYAKSMQRDIESKLNNG